MIGARKSWLALVIVTASLVLLDACAVGPQFKKPAAPTVAGYTTAPMSATSSTPKVVGGEAQQFFDGRDIPGEW